ncbi:MAG: hypothetical protein J0L92_28620, partial [Deltaproteobacteria bacterium]|nr:hypothetical protein [Deltaproteobacteria bacterium]
PRARSGREPSVRTSAREPTRPSKPRPGDEVPAKSGPPDAFIYALVVAVLFLSGFVIWRFVRRNDPSTPVTTTTSAPTSRPPPETSDPSIEPPETSEPTPPATSDEATDVEPPPTSISAGSVEGAFGNGRPNHEPPAAGNGWIVADVEGWRVDGTELSTGTPRALPIGIHLVERGTETVRARFVRVLDERTVVLPSL